MEGINGIGTLQPKPEKTLFCECGQPSAGKSHNGSTLGCLRCQSLESVEECLKQTSGISFKKAKKFDPLYWSLRSLDRACDDWLRKRGLINTVSDPMEKTPSRFDWYDD